MHARGAVDDKYLSDALEVLAGPFIEGVDLLLDGDAVPFVKSARSRRHVLMALCDCSPGAGRSALERLGVEADDRALLAWVYQPMAPMFPCVLRRLGREPLIPGDYTRINTAIINNHRLGRVLTQLGTLTPDRVQIALALPTQLQERSVIELCPGVREASALAGLFALAVRIGRRDGDLAVAVRRARSWADIRLVIRKATTPQKLCEPPWEGDDQLVWVPTTSKLKETGGRLANCLLALSELSARSQEAAYYVWGGDGTEGSMAVCAVVNERPFGWRVAELEGHGNQEVRPDVRAQVLEKLAQHGVEHRPAVADLLRAI